MRNDFGRKVIITIKTILGKTHYVLLSLSEAIIEKFNQYSLKKKRLYWKFSGWHKCVPLLKLFEGGGGTKNFSKSDRRMTAANEQTKTLWNICFREEGGRPNVCMFICQNYFFVCTSIAYFNQLLIFCISETVGSRSPLVWRSWSTSLLGWTSFAWEEHFCHSKMFLKMKKFTLNIKHDFLSI